MPKSSIVVKFTKEFVSGSLKGMFYDTTVKAHSLEDANEWINYCHAHKTLPVKAIGGGDYIIHLARIETVTDLCDCGEPKDHDYKMSCVPF